MKVSYFQQVPYRYLPTDFGQRSESVVTVAYHDNVKPALVHDSFRHALDELMLAARSGFDAVAVTEHAQSSYDMSPNPSLLAAALAHATTSEGLEVGIYPVGRSLGKAREPLRVAEEYAMVDAISGGRLIAGFPVGLTYDANINNGVPPAETRARFAENLALVLRAWQERQPFAHNGRFTQHPAVNIWPRPLQEPHPPVWVTGIGSPGSMVNALSTGLGYNYFGWFGANTTGQRIFDRFWATADRLGVERNPYRVGFMQSVAVADTDAEAERLYRPHVEYFFHNAIGNIPFERMALPGSVDPVGLDAMLRDPGDLGVYPLMRDRNYRQLLEAGSVIAGSADTVTERLTDLVTRFGIGNLHVMLQFGSMPHELATANIERFSTSVLPLLAALWSNDGHAHHWWPTRLGGDTPATVTASPRSGR